MFHTWLFFKESSQVIKHSKVISHYRIESDNHSLVVNLDDILSWSLQINPLQIMLVTVSIRVVNLGI
mgnify:CR=1 FL=1